MPGTGCLVVNDPRYVPAAVRDIAIASHMQLEVCAADIKADWTYVSPPALLLAGERTGSYQLGRDDLLIDAEGRSRISIEDFALALLDEAESPKHRRSRFTVAARALEVSESDVVVTTPDGKADCYFAHPTSGACPGVIVWPDALGLRPAFRTLGRRLAQSNYSALVVNPYYRQTAAPIGVDGDSFNEPAGRTKAMSFARSITADMTTTDAIALAGFLGQQKSIDSARKLSAIGYCMGGAMTIRTAAAIPDRIAAIASFHGSKLMTQEASSPHLLIADTRPSALIAIAESDDHSDPNAKTVLREAYARANLAAEIEVYAGTMHGWCSPDIKAYDAWQAERAWSRLLALFNEALT